jgi:hypothetical protein
MGNFSQVTLATLLAILLLGFYMISSIETNNQIISRLICPQPAPSNLSALQPKPLSFLSHTVNEERRKKIHMFWVSNVNINLNRKVESAFRSALRTQSEAQVIVWTLPSHVTALLHQTQALRELHCASGSTLEVRSTDDLLELALKADNPLLRSCSNSFKATEGSMVHFSDFIRFMALYFFGGIYVDADTMFLQDMRSLHGQSFAYKWDRDVTYYNTAIMGLPKGSPLVPHIISKAGACNPGAFYPIYVSDKLECSSGVCEGLIMMPTSLFNPSSGAQNNWRWNDNGFQNLGMTADWFFNRPRLWGLDNFFPGAYTFHWHNRWDMAIHNESFFADLELLNANCLTTPTVKRCRKVFVDFGAYTGDTLETYGREFIQKHDNNEYSSSEVYAFEVDFKHITSILERLAGPLAYLRPFTHVFNAAVWNKDVVLKFHASGHNDGKVTDAGQQQVLGYDIGPWFMRSIRPSLCDNLVVKVDIEGAEVEALHSLADAGALLFIDHLIIEWHDWINPTVAAAKPELVRLLEENGLYYNYATLDDKLDMHFKIGEQWPVNHCDSHYLRSKP